MSTTHFSPLRIVFIIAVLISSTQFASSQEDRFLPTYYYALFNVAEYNLTRSEYNRFKELYDGTLLESPGITLIGHTDSDGGLAYNKRLSEERVNRIRDLLISFGYSKDKISISYHGEQSPLNSNSNEEEKRQNRRVTVTWEPPVPLEIEEFGDIQELYKLLEQEKQIHCIDPNGDTTLVLKQGTIIDIPAGSFNTTSTDCVTLRVKEVYKFSDMIMENLATTANGRLLETGGMIFTEAIDSRGNDLKLKPGKELTIMLPADTLRDDMRLFYGERDPHQNMNWELPAGDIATYKYGSGGGGGGRPAFSLEDCSEWERQANVCESCSFFFCRIGRMGKSIKGIVNKDTRSKNKSFRDCQKKLRKNDVATDISPEAAGFCNEMFAKYDVNTWEELQDTLQKIRDARNQIVYDRYGVSNDQELRDTLRKIKEKRLDELMQDYGVETVEELRAKQTEERKKRIEDGIDKVGESIDKGEGNLGDLQFYVLQTNRMGWINCDAFSGFPEASKIDMLVDMDRNSETDCSLVFKDRKSMMKTSDVSKFRFNRIAPKIAIWILALKFRNKKAFISLTSDVTKLQSDPIKFKEVSIDELKSELRKLDM